MKYEYLLTYSTVAKEDIYEAAGWYELQQKGLGKKFKNDVSLVIANINKNPFYASIKYAAIRTAACKIFPYAVHYEVDEVNKVVRVISIFHFSRKPK